MTKSEQAFWENLLEEIHDCQTRLTALRKKASGFMAKKKAEAKPMTEELPND